MKASAVHARQEAYLKLQGQIRSQPGTIAGRLYISSQGAPAGGTMSRERQTQLFAELGLNDTEVFSRKILEFHLSTTSRQCATIFFYGTVVRAPLQPLRADL